MSRTALVCMPWLLVDSPCIQTGRLQAALHANGLEAAQFSFHLAFLEFAARVLAAAGPLTAAEYEQISTRWSNCGLPEWLFAVPPYLPEPGVAEATFAAEL